jgi:hypothetical protein
VRYRRGAPHIEVGRGDHKCEWRLGRAHLTYEGPTQSLSESY